MAIRTLPDREFVRECLDYDPRTGEFRWRNRPPSHFRSAHEYGRWNTRFARTIAGATDKATRYRRILINARAYKAHRIAWLLICGEPLPAEIDHIDGDRGNNRIDNLRAATKLENGANSRIRPDNKTGFKGVFRLTDGRFRAKININYKQIHIGYFATLEEAAEARRAAAIRLNGEFARHT